MGMFLRLLGEESRLRIFSLLTKAELCVCEVEDSTGLSQSLVSNHLGALRRAGLVESRRDDEDGRWISTAPIGRQRPPCVSASATCLTCEYRPATGGAPKGCVARVTRTSPSPTDQRTI